MPQDDFNSQPPNSQPPQPFWKAKVIQFLRGAIGILEVTVDKLEAEPVADNYSDPGRGWGGILNRIRSFLPSGLAAQLSDTALSSAIALVVVVLIWGTSSTLFANKPTEIATVPEVEPVTVPSIPLEPSPPIAEETPVIEDTEPPPEETPPVVEDTEPPPEEIPPVAVEEPTQPTPVFVPLTPEQTLIAAIESRISEVSELSSGIIKSTQANFATSSLVIKVSDEWYNLKPKEQNKLASQMFQRSQDLDFTHLEIVDILDRIVARNPVVGTEMIIFQRQIN
jgi:outer membrane biosynthesis protein TonB